jgi:uncharacterized membrane protein
MKRAEARYVKPHASTAGFEPRWPVVLALTVVIAILALLPETLRIFPLWVTFALGILVLVPVVAVGLSAAHERWLRIEHAAVLGFIAIAVVLLFVNLANLFGAILYRSAQTTGLQLLSSSVALWITNVLVFSLLYWRIDRGGPEARVRDRSQLPDWLFPQENAPSADVPATWRPAFVDYFYLSYSTATAFSATDTVPLTSRAKMFMMAESAISLFTIILIAARAINILGS